MSYVMQAASDYNEFKKTVANRFHEKQSIDRKIENVLQNRQVIDENEKMEKEEIERIMNFLLKEKF